ncbi:hypothetical protein F5Y06DRAFT_177723 [Hypoxylon sp. FL0890]|nr:hypothetical protein F5Y06DRAFT_177723 [Hypoxylon sp. FL0890]
MAPGSPSPRDQGYIPRIPSPLNPLSTETQPKRHRRNDHSRATKHEQSPTQRLMRQKAAAAWKSISSDDGAITNHSSRLRNEVGAKLSTQMEDSYPALTDTAYHAKAVLANQCHEADSDVRQGDMEKQALVEGDSREDRLFETGYFSHITTRRLIITLGLLCIVGILSIIRAVGRIQGWRT